jgi:hypothetical protein
MGKKIIEIFIEGGAPVLYCATLAVTRDLGFSRFHPKDRPIQSLLTTHEGMWRIYSNPDLNGCQELNVKCIYYGTMVDIAHSSSAFKRKWQLFEYNL